MHHRRMEGAVTPSAPRGNDPVGLGLGAHGLAAAAAGDAAGGTSPVQAVRPLELARRPAGHRPQQGRPEEAVPGALGCHSVVAQVFSLP